MSAPSIDDAWARHWAERIFPGATLGRYELLVRLAAGGMGEVWAARMRGSRGFEKLVALKLLLPHLAGDDEFEERFAQEARIIVQVQHPNVASAIDFGEVDGLLFLVMEWLPGISLARLLKAAPAHALPVPVAVRVAMQACAGLHAAHELRDARGRPLGVVHCDVSPQNVLITFDGIVKVLDFGVAVLSTLASAGRVPAGKRRYFAPEQASGGPIDRRVDVFAMGLVLHLTVTGQHPGALGGQPGMSLERAVLAQSRARHAPHELERIVLRALEVNPSRRFQTADELSRALAGLPSILRSATDQDVAEMVGRRCGAAHRETRQLIDEAIQRLERSRPSVVPPSGSRTAGSRDPRHGCSVPPAWLEEPTLPAPDSNRGRARTALRGVLSLMIIGSISASGWWFSQRADVPSVAASHDAVERLPLHALAPSPLDVLSASASIARARASSAAAASAAPPPSASGEPHAGPALAGELPAEEGTLPERAIGPLRQSSGVKLAPAAPARPRAASARDVRPTWRHDPGF